MGKRQHQKDKLYLTTTEWTTTYGGKKQAAASEGSATFRRLPLNHCALSLKAFENPFCDPEGNVFDLESIVPFLKKFKINPVSGKGLDPKSLIKLNFYKNSDGKYQCPVMYRVFTNTSHVVAIKTTGNVYSYDAVEELNLKTKNWKDLLTDKPFTRQDIVTIQDPEHLEKFNLSLFHHVRNNLRVDSFNDAKRLKCISTEAKETLAELAREYKEPEKKPDEKKVADKFNAAHYSTGLAAAGLTSTAMQPETSVDADIVEEDIVRYRRVKKKGYVRLVTSAGPLNLELYSDAVPKTCENFIKCCQKGYYNGTIFHRSIRNFMLQGGDPTGTGTGGESIWGKPFEDEFKPNLTHSGRGVLSMANSGPNNNKSQFFITYRSCNHLDGKHTVFGKLVGGLDTLTAIENAETDNKDRPVDDIVIDRTPVFVDPYEEADEQLAKERQDELQRQQDEAAALSNRGKSKKLKVFNDGVGKYINLGEASSEDSSAKKQVEPPPLPSKKNVISDYSFGNFSSW